jgi:hypothetical protein
LDSFLPKKCLVGVKGSPPRTKKVRRPIAELS